MAIGITKTADTIIEFYLHKKIATEFREANKERFDTTSPYALTTDLPALRIDSNPIIEGGGSAKRWAIGTRVQRDKVYTCPITGREFLDEDMTSYKDDLQREMKDFVKETLKDLRYSVRIEDPDWYDFAYAGKTGSINRSALLKEVQ